LKDGNEYSLTDSTVVGIDGSNNTGNPATFEVGYNYPNPFNGNTRINYTLSKQANIQIRIYDLAGQEIFAGTKNNLQPGRYQFSWNGLDNEGQSVSTGIYFLALSGEDDIRQIVRKLVYLK
jgi:hypothetical protein